MNTENELKKAKDSLAKIICTRIDELEKNGEFQSKEIKELTSIVKDLSAIERSLESDGDSSEIKIVFEGGDIKWAQ